MSFKEHRDAPSASLLKQLAAMLYDSMLIFAVLFVATAIALLFTGGEAIEANPLFNLYLVFIVFTYYAWFWKKSGQTLGMRVWKIKIVSELGGLPSWSISYMRLVFALLSMSCFGLGYIWRLFKPFTWHDRLSQTRVIDTSASADGDAQPGSDGV